MYLKSIEVNGFKSFANKIVFKFNHGITCIVGPNGSGKSNVADAVRWVLGEQSAKSLRGSKMEDVIFSGTQLRKPQGSAYVAITLDNSDHSLPIDYGEVTVARRVYRSGESEYLINGTVSRLKDVYSLFFDTGIGKEGYSIIGQGQIEKILNGKPEERRELFDEAAGIVKFKKNKAATEKSLEAERDNLSRVNDILKELEKQVGPLKEQSETARKYLAFKSELKNLDVNAFLLEIEKLRADLERDQARLEIVNDDITENKQLYEQTKEEYEQIENTIEQLDSVIDSSKNEIHENRLAKERAEGEINVINQQIITLKMNDKNIHEQIDRITAQIESGELELAEYTSQKDNLDDSSSDVEKALQDARKQSEDMSRYIEECQQEIENCKADIIEYMHESGTLQAKVGRYIIFRKRTLCVPDLQITKAVHIDIAVAVFRRPLCRSNGLAQLDLVQFHNDCIGDDEQECRIVLKACRVVHRDIALIDALGKWRCQYGFHTVVLEELILIRVCVLDCLHVRYDNRPVQRQKFTPARKAFYGKILEHVLLVLYAFRTPFVGKQSDLQIPVCFYNGSSGRTVKLRCTLQQTVDNVF